MAENVTEPARRRSLIEARPDVAGGVVVAAGVLAQARAVLEAAGLNPAAAVCVVDVGSAAHAPEISGRFVVDPHPALYDPRRAAALREDLATELACLEDDLTRLEVAVAAAGEARGALDGFCRRWPPDADDAVADALGRALAAVRDAEAELARAGADAERAEVAVAVAEEARRQAEARVAALVEAKRALEAARPLVVAGAEAQAGLGELVGRESKAVAAAQLARGDQRLAQGRRDVAVETRASAGAAAAELRRAQAAVGVEPGPERSEEPVDAQQATLAALRAGLVEREAGSDHAASLAAAKAAAAERRQVVDQLAPEVLAGAEARAGQVEATDVRSRVAAGEARHSGALRREQTVRTAVDEARKTMAARAPRDGRQVHAVLGEEWQPLDVDDAAARRQRVDVVLAELRQLQAAATAAGDRLRAEVAAVELQARLYSAAAARWSSAVVVAPGAVAAFAGTTDEAGHALDAARTRRDELVAHQRRLAEAERDALDAVRSVARDRAWAGITSVVQQACDAAVSNALLVANAGEWAARLAVRERSLADDLRDLDVHRKNIVTHLHGLCRDQHRLLRQVTRFSTLPPEAGALAGNPAVRVEFTTLSELDARARLAQLVDEWATKLASTTGRGLDAKARVVWLCDALRRTVKGRADGSAWRVEVLKPTVDSTVSYRTPDRIREFSGGQELTLAILVYVTLAGVRAANRSAGQRPPIPLLSDNPFGKASNEALIRLQHALAAAAGVQLVCASGLEDPSVLTAFEGPGAVVVRLRNDRAQRTGLRHLRVIDEQVEAVVGAALAGGRSPSDPAAYLDAQRYRVHP